MKFRHLLFTTDLSDDSLLPLRDVLALGRALDARLTVLHVVHPAEVGVSPVPYAPRPIPRDLEAAEEDARQILEERVRRVAGQQPVQVVALRGTRVAEAVQEYAQSNGVDLVVSTTHGRSGFRRLVLGSQVESIVRASEVPVLCIPLKGSRTRPSEDS